MSVAENLIVSDHRAAWRSLAALRLDGGNREAARCWLASWNGGKPPSRNRFLTNCDSRLKPAIAVFEVCRARSVRCVFAGVNFRLALGFDLAGQDILSLTPAADRAVRLAHAWSIGDGLIMTGSRKFRTSAGADELNDEIYLPLARPNDADIRFYLMHSNWRPIGEDWSEGRVDTNLGLTNDPHTAALACL